MATLSSIAEQVRKCTRCPLWKHRLQPLPGQGKKNATSVFILESPDEIADRKGDLWESKEAKQLLSILKEKKIQKKDVFLTTLVKCSSQGSLVDTREIEECHSYLQAQLNVMDTKKVFLISKRKNVPEHSLVKRVSQMNELKKEL